PPKAGARDWRTQMHPGAVAAFEAIAGSLLDSLGYGRGAPRPGVRLGIRAWGRGAGYRALEMGSEARKALRHRLTGHPGAGVGAAPLETAEGTRS
ncbi:MAG: hypothetical protein LC722_02405, partial [Actinobacteria bacterium]|nr:hypothetical protein [Actinomycetota bacterium]